MHGVPRHALSSQAAGGRAIAVQADVTQQDAPSNVVSAAIKAFGRIDILVNNAGAVCSVSSVDTS